MFIALANILNYPWIVLSNERGMAILELQAGYLH